MKTIYKANRKRIEGFTLIEVLVVVIMIGVLAAIAAPGWLSFLTRQRMGAVNSDLMNVIRDVQADAIQQRTARQITISSLGSTPSVTVSDAISNNELYTQELGSDASALQLAAFSLDSSDNWSPVDPDSPIIIAFDYRGAVSTTSPYIVKVEPKVSNSTLPPKCVIITTILGGLKPDQGETCNTFVAQE